MPHTNSAGMAAAEMRGTAADAVLAALGDRTRRALIEQLAARREVRVTDLAVCFDMTRPAISQHLRVLREAGLVQETPKGRERLYRLAPTGFQVLERWLQHYEHFWNSALSRLGDVLDAEEAREREATRG
jgi:DNA-binding transcriptional ArsR family regulator